MDSTANLLSRLDLDETPASSLHEEMDDMDIDLVEGARAPAINPRVGFRRRKHAHHWRDSGRRDFGGDGSSSNGARNDTEGQHRRAKLIQSINDALGNADSQQPQGGVFKSEQGKSHNEASFEKTPKSSLSVQHHPRSKSYWKKKGKEQLPVSEGGDFVLKTREKRGKREGNCLRSDPIWYDVSRKNQGQRGVVHGGYSGPHNSTKNQMSAEVSGRRMNDFVNGEAIYSYLDNSRKNRMTGTDFAHVSQPSSGLKHGRWSKFASPAKNTEPTRLVRYGDSSHSNGRWGMNATQDSGVGATVHSEHVNGNSSHQIVNSGSESRCPDKEKGKMIMENYVFSGGQEIKAERLEMANEAPTSADDSAFRSFEDVDWTGKASTFPSEERKCVSRRDATCGHLSNLRHRTSMQYRDRVNHVDASLERTASDRFNPLGISAPESEIRTSGSWGQQKFMNRKGECNSICSNCGGSSCSTCETSEALHLQSSRRILRAVDFEHDSDSFDPCIELDIVQSPEARHNDLEEQSAAVPDRSSARISQLESDEMLARQLQEQFYDEVVGSASTEEIDATIAWSLQQEDARLGALAARSGRLDNRESSMAHLYEYYARLPYRNSSARWSNHAQSQTSNRRRNYYGSETDLETRMMAEVRNFTGMDQGMEI